MQPALLLLLLAGEHEETHWAYRPLAVAEELEVLDESWCRTPVDRFVLSALEAKGLSPAPEADRETLLRRLSLDLCGLPPSPQEVAEFISDAAPDAYERLVERLLAAPAYAERWARHWLDVARYGDSNGADENHPLPHAYHYRNWVIDAFARDLPYDQFVVQQLAGDLLPPLADADEQAAQVTATGLLAIGTKILAEKDEVKRRMDFVDEQVDTVSKAFLGLTVACARCHDHKFDAIPTRDYYALAGIFHSTEVMDRTVETEEYLLSQTRHTADIEAAALARDELLSSAVRSLLEAEAPRLSVYSEAVAEVVRWREFGDPNRALAERLDSATLQGRGFWAEAEDFDRGNVAIAREGYGKGIGIISDPGAQENFVEYDVQLERSGLYRAEFRYAALSSRPARLMIDGDLISDRLLAGVTGGWDPEHQRWSLEGEVELAAGGHVLRIESAPLMSHLDQLALIRVEAGARVTREAETFDRGNGVVDDTNYGDQIGIVGDLGEHPLTWIEYDWDLPQTGSYAIEVRYAAATSRPMRLLIDGELVESAALSEVTGDWYPAGQRWHTEARASLIPGRHVLRLESEGHLPHLDQLRVTLLEPGALPLRSPSELAQHLGLRAGLLEAMADRPLEHWEETFPAAVEREFEPQVAEHLESLRARVDGLEASRPAPRTVMAASEGEVADLAIHIRGDHLELGEKVPRGFLEALGSGPAIPAGSSGRLALARWLTSPANPLPARVFVNRVWRWHFGKGLAPSPNDLGTRSLEPSHPQLLDQLARDFMTGGWSVKDLHRSIVNSATYRQATQGSPEAHAVDPGNRLLARQSRTRLEAEVIRDSLLTITGRLDSTIGGPPLEVVTQNPSPTDLVRNREVYESSDRRSIYLPVVRTNVYEVFSLFDFPSASMSAGDRDETTVPTQALWMMNSPWVRDCADQLAQLALKEGGLDALYIRVLGRACTDSEHRLGMAFLGPTPGLAEWSALAQVLLSTNDFVYRN